MSVQYIVMMMMVRWVASEKKDNKSLKHDLVRIT